MPASFQRLPGHFQQESLLGVHRQRLARAEPEELGVELRGVVEEAPAAAVALACPIRVGVVRTLHVPAAIARELANRVPAREDQLPKLGG